MILLRFVGGAKKNAAKTISCCLHYLMHHLQSGKWTRTQMTVRGKQPYLATCRNVRKQLLKWEDMGRGRDLVCSLCSSVILRVVLKPPLCIQPHEILPMHWPVSFSPFSCLIHPSPYSLPGLLLTLVCPNKPFMLKQFRTPKGKKNIYYGSLHTKTSHRQPLHLFWANQRYVVHRPTEANWDI